MIHEGKLNGALNRPFFSRFHSPWFLPPLLSLHISRYPESITYRRLPPAILFISRDHSPCLSPRYSASRGSSRFYFSSIRLSFYPSPSPTRRLSCLSPPVNPLLSSFLPLDGPYFIGATASSRRRHLRRVGYYIPGIHQNFLTCHDKRNSRKLGGR